MFKIFGFQESALKDIKDQQSQPEWSYLRVRVGLRNSRTTRYTMNTRNTRCTIHTKLKEIQEVRETQRQQSEPGKSYLPVKVGN